MHVAWFMVAYSGICLPMFIKLTPGLTGRLLQRKQLEGIVFSNVKFLILQADYFIYFMFMQQKLL